MSWLCFSALANVLLLLLLVRQLRRTGEQKGQAFFWHERYVRLVEADERPILPYRRPARANYQEATWNGHPRSSN